MLNKCSVKLRSRRRADLTDGEEKKAICLFRKSLTHPTPQQKTWETLNKTLLETEELQTRDHVRQQPTVTRRSQENYTSKRRQGSKVKVCWSRLSKVWSVGLNTKMTWVPADGEKPVPRGGITALNAHFLLIKLKNFCILIRESFLDRNVNKSPN